MMSWRRPAAIGFVPGLVRHVHALAVVTAANHAWIPPAQSIRTVGKGDVHDVVRRLVHNFNNVVGRFVHNVNVVANE